MTKTTETKTQSNDRTGQMAIMWGVGIFFTPMTLGLSLIVPLLYTVAAQADV